jgi:hypothetical protein
VHRANAYSALATELEKWRMIPFAELAALVGAPTTRIAVRCGGEEFEIEVNLTWEGFEKEVVRVIGTANGPSSWCLERLQESIVVSLR